MREPKAPAHCVLLVDDDKAVRRSVAMFLRARGYDVRDYSLGAELLADSALERGTCLITDYVMPDLDGFALLEALRNRNWSAPAILIAGRYERDLQQRSLRCGFSALIEKPITDERLLDALHLCLCKAGT
ncbi:response regulator [Sphingobium sp. Ant17]|uniref:response regulator n=1 Tax=Sphingobium sp. Ant17 TaxID=1461752 RepID=UPI0005B97E74|nr:response regulator [Sphingobium sp. Ant17]